MDRADAALNAHWPDRTGPDYEREMLAAATELKSVAAELRKAGADRLEQGRTQRLLGSVYSDLASASGHDMLERARDAYLEAERLLAGQEDALEHAKLDFNFGNTLRQLDPDDVALLTDARRRFLRARAIFQERAPRYLAQVDDAVRSVGALLKLAPVAAAVSRNVADMEAVQKKMAEGAAVAEEAGRIMRRDGGIAGLMGRIQGVLAQLPEELQQDERFGEIQKQLGKLMQSAARPGPRDPDEASVLDALRKRLSADVGSGKVAKGRAAGLERLIDRIGGMLSGADDIGPLMKTVQDMRTAAEESLDLLHYPSYGIARPPHGSRASQLVELCWRLRRVLIEAMNRPNKGVEENDEALALNVRASEVDRRIYEAGADDDESMRVDQDELRPLALAVRAFASKPNVMIARPIWTGPRAPTEASTVFYSGSPDVRRILTRLARRRGLSMQQRPRGQGFANARWNQLQRAATTVFDLGGSDGPARAAVCYELGMALTLGKPVVVVSDQPELPFDVDLEPIVLAGEAGDEEELSDALDQSLVWTPSGDRRESLAETINRVLGDYPRPGANTVVDQTLRHIGEMRGELDPVAVTHALDTLVASVADTRARTIHPRWAPVYGDPGVSRLFHVMPFGPGWARKATEAARAACDGVGTEYVRGDEVTDPDVIRSIWEEINRASHVLVDLTGFNSNVALEAGIAHTLGRPTLLVGRSKDVMDRLFPNIAKLRVHPYEDPASRAVAASLRGFLS
jgi:nucleoside 2-deoxyribosyltransferase